MDLFPGAEDALSSTLGQIQTVQAIAGGSINKSALVTGRSDRAFVKWHANAPVGFFEAEQVGLTTLRDAGVRAPAVLGLGHTDACAFLCLEYVPPATVRVDRREFGEHLADLVLRVHAVRDSSYGLNTDNYIGTLVQTNTARSATWSEFFIHSRIAPLQRACQAARLLRPDTARLLARFVEEASSLLAHAQSPTLVHGDLWSGNYLVDHEGRPWLVDPAVYFGAPEMDIAFSELFGGFPKTFYTTYWQQRGSPENYPQLRAACQVYPLLVHLRLFGGSYAKTLKHTLLTALGLD